MKVIHTFNIIAIAAAGVTIGDGSSVSAQVPAGDGSSETESSAHPRHRLLGSLNLFNSLFGQATPEPRVESCFGGIVPDPETGEQVPLITCNFSTTKRRNATAAISVGPCEDVKEVCGTELRDGGCAGPFVQTGKIRVDMYPELEDHELDAKKFNRTYCARADIYQYSEKSNVQYSVSHIKRELRINFANKNDREEQRANVALNTPPDEVVIDYLNPAIFIGSFLGILAVIALSVALRTARLSSFPAEDVNSTVDPEDAARREPDGRRTDIV